MKHNKHDKVRYITILFNAINPTQNRFSYRHHKRILLPRKKKKVITQSMSEYTKEYTSHFLALIRSAKERERWYLNVCFVIQGSAYRRFGRPRLLVGRDNVDIIGKKIHCEARDKKVPKALFLRGLRE